MLKSRTVGGAAAAAGFSFQDSVAAWAAVDLLAEQSSDAVRGLDPSVTYREIRCETGLPVDDLMIVPRRRRGVRSGEARRQTFG